MTTRLMQSLKFTEEDLAYNRKGTLSPQQNERVKARRRTLKLALLVLGLILLGAGVAFLPSAIELYSQGNSNWVGNAVTFGVFALIGLPFTYLGIRPMRPVKIATVRGPAKIARVERTSRSNNSTSTYIATEMHIVGKVFTMPDAAFPELEDGAMYAVHYWEGINEVFSVERV